MSSPHPLDRTMNEAIADGAFPGASLLAFKAGQAVWESRHGHAQLTPNKRELRADTLFDIASLTKPFSTASLAMLSFEEGLLRLEDPVQKYLPAFKKPEVTVGHLLNHSSGLPAWKAYYEEVKARQPALLGTHRAQAWVIERVCAEPLENPAGSKVVYSDLGYMLLGAILETIHGKTIPELFRQKIAQPLGLHNTFFRPDGSPPDPDRFAATELSAFRGRILCGEVDDDNTYAIGGHAGHAGLFSDARDVFRWLNELREARSGRSPWLRQGTFERFCSVPEKRDPDKAFFTYGFDTPVAGSQAGARFSLNSIGHLAYSGCSFWWDLDRDFGIILLTNRVHPDPKNQKIRAARKKIQDAVVSSLKLDA